MTPLACLIFLILGDATGTLAAALEPLGRLDHPADPRGVGDRREPASSRGLLGPQRLGQPPGPVRGPARRHARPRVSPSTSRTSTGKTSRSTTTATSTSATSATTAACCRSGRSTGSTSPTRPRPATSPLPVTRRVVLPLPARGPVRRRGARSSTADRADRRGQDVRRPRGRAVLRVPLDPPAAAAPARRSPSGSARSPAS